VPKIFHFFLPLYHCAAKLNSVKAVIINNGGFASLPRIKNAEDFNPPTNCCGKQEHVPLFREESKYWNPLEREECQQASCIRARGIVPYSLPEIPPSLRILQKCTIKNMLTINGNPIQCHIYALKSALPPTIDPPSNANLMSL